MHTRTLSLLKQFFCRTKRSLNALLNSRRPKAACRKVEGDATRALLKRVLDTIIFLSHQGIPLHRHRESFTDDSVN